MDVFVADEQSDYKCDLLRLRRLAELVAVQDGVDARAELSILLVDAEAMAAFQERYLGETGPTDVLAFPMDDAPIDDEPYMLGDIVICPHVANEQALSANIEFEAEMDRLAVHGFLHLLGYDHARAVEARSMRNRENRILAEFNRLLKEGGW